MGLYSYLFYTSAGGPREKMVSGGVGTWTDIEGPRGTVGGKIDFILYRRNGGGWSEMIDWYV